MKKQDRQGVRTVAGLERKYAIGQSFKKAQGGIEKATEDANQAKVQAQNANTGLEKVAETAQDAKLIAREAKQAAAEASAAAESASAAAENAVRTVNGISLSVENKETTAKIILKLGDTEIPVTIDMQGLATVEKLKSPGAAEVHGENVRFGKICSADGESLVIDLDTGIAVLTGSLTTEKQWDENGNCRYTELSPEGVRVWLLEAEENGQKAAQAELTPTGLAFPLGNGRVSGIIQPEEDMDAVNKAYLEAYVAQELDKLRAELTNKDTETDEQE